MDAKAAHDPANLIAVVGMAGRFPGAPDVESLWTLLMGRGDAIRPVPADRWDATAPLDPEREVQAVGGFLDGVDLFDAGFFGISPREAADIDPQQRLMLEMSWRALEDAGLRAADLAGSRTGVYIGASWHDYELLRRDRDARTSQHSLVGNALDVIAARVSYFLKLRGPSMTVETGCSSSLVALHLAAQALRQGDIGAAIVGGVNLILTPDVSVGLTHFGGLSPDGRCAAFGDGANGYVRGEGVAALVVKTLAQALRDGDHVHGVIARTVVNNDGGGDSLVTPSIEGQRELLTQAYGDGLIPRDAVAYIEAHGTGTGRGDPVEATAIGLAVGQGRGTGPLPIGSVKTNIGHLEAAAGLAGLVKVLLALRHRTVPPSLHSARLNPQIPFADLNISVVREPLALPATDPIYLGVNSFGWGGTNAHVVVTTPPAPCGGGDAAADAPRIGLPALVPVSAKSRTALASRARQLSAAVPATDDAVVAFAGTLGWRREHFPVRAAVVSGGADLRAALAAIGELSDGEPDPPDTVTGRAVPRRRIAFVFPGQGSQWRGMGRALYRESPLFAEVIHSCAEALRPYVSWDLRAVIADEAGDEWMSRIDMLQPALWAMSLGLAELWRASGVAPDVVLGHSQGEITAATLAGILSYEDAALAVARRSAIVRRACGRGLMLAVDLDPDSARAALAGFEEAVSLAVHNGPRSCVLSGDRDHVLMLKELLDAEGTFCRLVNVDYASHSPQMDALRDDLRDALSPVTPRPGQIGLMSTVRVGMLSGAEMDASYWVENLRRPVQFAQAMGHLLDDGVSHVIEISPHPVLVPAVEQLAAERTEPVAVLATLRRDSGGARDFAAALARGYVAGLEPFAGLPRRHFPVPGYPLQGESYWPPARTRRAGASRGFDVELAPVPAEADTWHGPLELALVDQPWLADHKVYDSAVLPGAAMLALAVNACLARTGGNPRRIDDVVFAKEIAFADEPVRLTVEWRDDVTEGGSFRLLSLPEGGTVWVVNATARLLHRESAGGSPGFPDWPSTAAATDPQEFYRTWAERGLAYGPHFTGVRALWTHPSGDEALGKVVLADRLRSGAGRHLLHPALWDGALQVSLALLHTDVAVVPTAVDRIRLLAVPAEPVTAVWSHAVRRDQHRVDVYVFDDARRPLLAMDGLHLRPLPGTDRATPDAERLHRLTWIETPASRRGQAAPGRWLVCGRGEAAQELAKAIAVAGVDVAQADPHDGVPAGEGQLAGVVFVAPGPDEGFVAQRRGLIELTRLVRACADHSPPPALTVVTRAAQAATADDQPDPGGALYWGYTRVLQREHSELSPRVVDVDPGEPDWAGGCAEEVLDHDGEDQVALRPGRRLAARLARGEPADTAEVELPPRRTGRQPFRVTTSRPGFWEGVECVPLLRREPGPGEIEVAVSASGLNFIDVMKALGTYPDPSGSATLLGGECAGQVTAVGPDVTGFAPGDRVVACAFGSLASHVTVRASHARPIPPGLSDADAAALPLAFATAWYALADLARLDPGETVLVHSAAGGVGLAAVQVVRALGGRVMATAGSEAKRSYLRSIGIADVFDSRELSWADEVRAATGGRGVDVVLNSLTGAAIPLGLDVLAEDGRFIELGKKDIYGGRGVSLNPFRKGISLAAVDLAGLMDRRPQRFARLLGAVWDQVADGTLTPLPVRRYPYAEVTGALREMSHGNHIGKFVVADPHTVDRVAPVPMPEGRFRADGTYLVTGGLGALGLSIAEFLASNGAGALALLGRSAPKPVADARIAALRAAGTIVEVLRCDVSDGGAVRAALDGIRDRMPPLRGVVHAAGLLADATIRTMTEEQVDQVLAPKADGVRNLDAATADDPLDLFVLFSSAAALVGNAGQAAYAAANAYLDAFAEARRRRGLPALSVQWGPFAEVGLAAQDELRGNRLAERGMDSFPTAQAWPALVRLLARDEPVIGYVPINLRRWFDAYPDAAALASWQWLYAAARDGESAATMGSQFRTRLLHAPREARIELAVAKVRELSGRVLGLDLDRVERETPFKDLGLDSLMGLELRNRLEAAFGIKLSPTLLWAYGNPKALAGALCEQLAATTDSG